MNLIEDMNQKPNKHIAKNTFWQRAGIGVKRYRLPVGDYIIENDRVADAIHRKQARGIPVKMMDFVGTYNKAVDTKYGIEELVEDVCGKSHERFRDECILAQNNGIKLIVLVENQETRIKGPDIWNPYIAQLSELHSWRNPRLFILDRKTGRQKYPRATRGITLQKACFTMQKKYGVRFEFCRPKDAGRRVVELLEGS